VSKSEKVDQIKKVAPKRKRAKKSSVEYSEDHIIQKRQCIEA